MIHCIYPIVGNLVGAHGKAQEENTMRLQHALGSSDRFLHRRQKG